MEPSINLFRSFFDSFIHSIKASDEEGIEESGVALWEASCDEAERSELLTKLPYDPVVPHLTNIVREYVLAVRSHDVCRTASVGRWNRSISYNGRLSPMSIFANRGPHT
jgi:hypothetical protein